MGKPTDELRALCAELGVAVTHGYRVGDGTERVNADTVTTLWPIEGDPRKSLTFEEEGGALWCVDDMCPRQAVEAALGGRDRDDG